MSLGSYDGKLQEGRPAGERMYHLDAYEGLGHATLGMWVGEPPYDRVRPRVEEWLDQRQRESAAAVAPVRS